MARLASQVKMGYYATPVEVVNMIKKILKIQPGARLLDTCCGEGEALKIIAEDNDVETYGAELDRERHFKSKKVLHNALWADSLHELICSRKAFGLLWLNPPYDQDEGGYEQNKKRLEWQFLKRHWNYLQDGGVLVYIIPVTVLKKVASFFHRKCRKLSVLRFPDKYYWDFKQIILTCYKGRPKKGEVAENISILQSAITDYSNIYDIPQGISEIDDCADIYEVPAFPKESDDLFFRSVRLDPDDGLKVIKKKSRVFNRVKEVILPPTEHKTIQPLMPLREGHLAMLLASGMMNGEVIGDDGQRLIVKGSVRKVQDKSHEVTESADKYIETDRYEISVRAICFDPVEMITIKSRSKIKTTS